MLSSTERKALGKKTRAAGMKFERDVRKDLESKGWIVDKWSNNVDLESQEIVKAKTRFIGGRPAGLGSGFPDFLCFQKNKIVEGFSVRFVEAKMTGILDKKEKLKLNYLKSLGFECYVAHKVDKTIQYSPFRTYIPGKRKSES